MLLSYLKVMRKQQNTSLIHKHRCCILVAVVCDYHWHYKAVMTYPSSVRNCLDTGQLPDFGAKYMYDVVQTL